MSRKIVTVITAITGDRVVIGEEELKHAMSMYGTGNSIRNCHKGLKELKL
jgi:hypothetical protein